MKENHNEFAKSWLMKARNDIITAKQTLLLGEESPTDTICFHAQQAIEKSFKGLLTFSGVGFTKTHNLLILLNLVLAKYPEFENYKANLSEMIDFAVDIRYPDEISTPSIDVADKSVKLAIEVYNKINTIIETNNLFYI
jgi:HEPN domain-containing protein